MTEIVDRARAVNRAARLLRDLTVEIISIGPEEFVGPVLEPILQLADAIESEAKYCMEQMDQGNIRILHNLAAMEKPETVH